ncbi:MAG: hypothetical protein ACODAU_08305 [Myxococcota bacterium]
MHGSTARPGTEAPAHAPPPDDAGALLGSFGTAPVLAMWAVGASLLSAVLNRVVLRTLDAGVPHGFVVELHRWFALPRNLAAIAGLVALTAGLYAFLRRRRVASLRRRVVLSSFAGIFLATITATTLMPSEWTRPRVVLFGTGAGSVLAVLTALIALRWRGPLGLRISVALFAASVFFALGGLVAQAVLPTRMWELSLYVVRSLRGLGEASYLLAPIAAVPSVRPLYPPRRARIGRLVGAVVGLAVLAVFVWGQQALGSDFPTILYGAQRLELLADEAALAYAAPLAVGFGIGAAALTSTSAPDRQAGGGVLLLLAGGHAPQSPSQLMMMVLGMTLLARALVAQAAAIRATRQAAEP